MTSPANLSVALVQQSNSDNAEHNIEKSIAGIRDAASQGAQLVVLQELHRSLYFCQTEDVDVFDLAETIPGPSSNTLGELAKELGIVIVASLFEKRATGLYHNTAVCSKKTAVLPVNTVKCIYRMTLAFMKSFTLLLAT